MKWKLECSPALPDPFLSLFPTPPDCSRVCKQRCGEEQTLTLCETGINWKKLSFPLALWYFNILVMVTHKDPNPENEFLSLETPLWHQNISALGPVFLLQGHCHAILAKQQYSCLCLACWTVSHHLGKERGWSLNKFSFWRAIRILKSSLHLCSVCLPLKRCVLKCHSFLQDRNTQTQNASLNPELVLSYWVMGLGLSKWTITDTQKTSNIWSQWLQPISSTHLLLDWNGSWHQLLNQSNLLSITPLLQPPSSICVNICLC